MIEKLYHTESYAEPINSIIKKVNEVVTAINCGTQTASTNTGMDAIAFDIEWFRPVLEKYIEMDLVPIALLEMIGIAQQHT